MYWEWPAFCLAGLGFLVLGVLWGQWDERREAARRARKAKAIQDWNNWMDNLRAQCGYSPGQVAEARRQLLSLIDHARE